MKNIIFLSACLLLSVTGIKAQSAGTLTFGANILHATICGTTGNNPAPERSLQARIGYFATPHLSIGLCLETGLSGNKTVPYGLTLFSRWYLGHQPQQTVKFFLEAGAGIADNKYTTGEMITSANNKWMRTTATLSAGINIFPARWCAVELAPEYRYIGGSHALNRIGISAGLKIFLSGQSFTKAFPNKFKSMY